jgi:penicillin-binding protein 2
MVVNVYASDQRPELRTDAYGRPFFEVDSRGRNVMEEPEFRLDPAPGQHLFIGLDIELQAFAESLLRDVSGSQAGSIVVLNADTGQALALASYPIYDPTIFVRNERSVEREDLFREKPSRMSNRCYRETYPPGSTFKIMLAVAALEEQAINDSSSWFCPGYFQLPQSKNTWRCWRRGGHGSPNVVESLAQSCDVFFYHTGLELGIDRIKKWSSLMGLGIKTGLDLGPEEVEGLIPSQPWREALMKKKHPDKPWEWRWYPGYTVNASIGQGEVNVTPLQNAVMMACIINGGRRVTPFLNMATGPKVTEKFISDRTLALVQEGMRACVVRGTGKQSAVKGFDILGKTGTAQVVRQKQREKRKEEDIPYAERDHAWFVAGVLDHEPKLAICVLVEHGLHGASSAAPLAKRVIEFFYARKSEMPATATAAMPTDSEGETEAEQSEEAHWDVLPPDLSPESGEGAVAPMTPSEAPQPTEASPS